MAKYTLQSRVVQCACDRLGGPEALAERLGMSTPMVRVWLAGTLTPPPRLFFRIVDILQEADPEYAALMEDGSTRPAAKPAAE
jgi:DNA-binding transcriptional regulator YdaS (Cro superfamily)